MKVCQAGIYGKGYFCNARDIGGGMAVINGEGKSFTIM